MSFVTGAFTRLELYGDGQSLSIPCESISLDIQVEKLEHFSSLGGLRAKDKEIITGWTGAMTFTPMLEDGKPIVKPISSSKRISMLSIGDLLEEIIRRQRGGEVEEEPEPPPSIRDQMEAAAKAGDAQEYNRLRKICVEMETCHPTLYISAMGDLNPKDVTPGSIHRVHSPEFAHVPKAERASGTSAPLFPSGFDALMKAVTNGTISLNDFGKAARRLINGS